MIPPRSMPTIGSLFHRFALEAPVRTPDGAGGATLTYALTSEVWGSLTATGGTKSAEAGRLAGTVTHTVWLRDGAGVTPAHRLRLGTRIFEIQAVLDHTGRQRFLECRCKETVT